MTTELSDETTKRMIQYLRPRWTVQENRPVTEGTDAVAFVTVEAEGECAEVVLKACTAVPPEDFRPEPYLLQALEAETSVPVPHVYDAVEDHPDLPAPFFMMERREGRLAADVDLTPVMRERLARDAGRFAGEYHTLGRFERHGRVRLDCDYTTPQGGMTVGDRTLAVADDAPVTWRAYVEDLYEGWIPDLDEEFADLRPELAAFIEERLDTLERPFTPVLGHIDYKPWNVLIRRNSGATSAVLDWAHATAMAPYYDLLLTEEHLSRWAPLDSDRRERVRSALLKGYAQTNRLERDAQFETRRELYLAVSRLQPLVWFSEWTANLPDDERRRRAATHREFVRTLLAHSENS